MFTSKWSLVGLAVLVAVMTSCAGQAGVQTVTTSSTSTTTATQSPTTSQAATTTSDPSLVAFEHFGLPMRLEADAGTWDVVDNLSDLITLEHRNSKTTLSFNLVTEAKIAELANGYALEAFPEDFVAWVQNTQTFRWRAS